MLKFSKRPPPYGVQLNSLAFRIMPLAVSLHFFFAIFVYTSKEIYPLATQDEDDVMSDFSVGIMDAIFSKFGIIFLIGALLMIAAVILESIIRSLICYLCKGYTSSKWENCKNMPNSFTDRKDWISVNNLVTYRIEANPNYAYIVEQGQRALKR